MEPTARHLDIVRDLLAPLSTGGNPVNDARLAVLCIEYHCEIVSYDTDYLRFKGVKLQTPRHPT